MATYDPKLVTVTFGALIITGFMDGTFINAAYNDEEEYKGNPGGDGEFSHTKNADRSGRITLTLKTTSSIRESLDQFRLLGSELPFWVRNTSDAPHLAGGINARIINRPEVNYGDEEEGVEYIFEMPNMTSTATPT